MTYRTTRRADRDITDVYVRGVKQFGAYHAEAYHDGLLAILGVLASNPRLARQRTEFKPPVRLYRYQAHMIVYVEHDPGILIVRVLHARQDWARHLE